MNEQILHYAELPKGSQGVSRVGEISEKICNHDHYLFFPTYHYPEINRAIKKIQKKKLNSTFPV